MNTYYIEFQVLPTEHNCEVATVEGAYAKCWIIENTEEAAHNKAYFFVSKDEWAITEHDTLVVEVTDQDFIRRDIELEQYFKAQKNGIAILYVAWARDGKSKVDLKPFEQTRFFNLNNYIAHQKKMTQSGRCLHFDSGDRCDKIIKAHSIQKSGQLSYIAVEGHVISPTKNIGSLKKNDGNIKFEKTGTGKVSTFLGFCKKHDNELFEIIDNWQLIPAVEQVFLYAYRSISKELFAEENALATINSQIEALPQGSFLWRHFKSMRRGFIIGIENLQRHKAEYDNSLRKYKYTDIEYTLFCSEQVPRSAFSGLFFPDYDFLGKPLQRLGVPGSRLDLITICSTPMDNGWGLLIAWHKSSSPTCRQFIQSLKICTREGGDIADTLFRLVISTSENLAFSPIWWESLPLKHRDNIEAHFSTTADILSPTPEDYLMKGLEGISQWEFAHVEDNLSKIYNR